MREAIRLGVAALALLLFIIGLAYLTVGFARFHREGMARVRRYNEVQRRRAFLRRNNDT